MYISDPNLTLTFLETPSSPVTTRSIEQNSISIKESYYTQELKASTDTVSLSLKPDGTTLIYDILAADNDIKAVLKDGNTALFTGYLTKSYTWRVNVTGEDVFNISIEDVGNHVLKKSWATEDSTCVRMSFTGVINQIIDRAGNIFSVIYDSSVTQSIKDTVLINKIDSGTSLQDILDQVCYELGLIYHFNASGNLVIRKTVLTGNADYTLSSTGPGNRLWTSGNSAIELTRQARQYRQVKVRYDILEDTETPIDVYQVTQQIEVPAGQWWDGETQSDPIYSLTLDEFFQAGKTYYIYSGSTWTEATVTVGDPVPDNTYYEYSGAASLVDMTDLEKGKDIIYVWPNSVIPGEADSQTPYPGYVEYTEDPGQPASKWTLEQYKSTDKLRVLIDNTLSSLTTYYTIFRAQARIIRISGQGSVYRAADGLTGNSENQYTYEAKWIHNKGQVADLASLLDGWYRFCDSQYIFYTDVNMPCGSLVSIDENLYTQDQYSILITGKEYTCYGNRPGVFKYTGRKISPGILTAKTQTGSESTTVPTFVPETPESAMVDISTSVSTVTKDLRTSTSQTIRIYATVTNWDSPISILVKDDLNNTYTVTTVTANREWTVNIPYNLAAEEVYIQATSSGLSSPLRATLSVTDTTIYNKFLGVFHSPANITEVVIDSDKGHDYFVCDQTTGTYAQGVTYEKVSGIWQPVSVLNPDKLLTALMAMKTAGTDFSTLSNPNTVSWFNTIMADTAILNSLFSHEITLLSPGYIKSDNYSPVQEGNVCTWDITHVDCEESFDVNTSTFISRTSTWGLGTYTITCTSAFKSDPHQIGGTDDGSWKIEFGGSQIGTVSDCSELYSYYGIDIDFDGEGYVTDVGDYFTVTSSYQTIPGQGFYLNSDGTFDCNNASAYNLNISGDSFFHGSFDCDVIATKQLNPATLTISQDGNDWQAAERMVQQMINAGWIPDWTTSTQTSEVFTATTTNFTSDLGYIRVQYGIQESPSKKYANIRFYAKNYTSNYRMDGPFEFYNGNDRYQTNTSTYIYTAWHNAGLSVLGGLYRTNGLTIQLSKGGNKLWLDVPSSDLASPLTTGMVYMKRTTDTIDGVTGHYLFVKD